MTKFLSGGSRTTQIGYIDRNRQMCCGTRGKLGNHGYAKAYKIKCMREECGNVYGANSCDIWLRQCPKCGNGAEGPEF